MPTRHLLVTCFALTSLLAAPPDDSWLNVRDCGASGCISQSQ